MFDIKKHECRLCSINEFNSILDTVRTYYRFINESANGKNIGPNAYLWSEISKCYLVFNDYSTPEHIVTRFYETDLNDEYEDGYLKYMSSVTQHCSAISRVVKLPKLINNKEEARVHASGIIWSNDKYNRNSVYCYEYDMHLAWLSTFMQCPLPNTSVPPRKNDIVKDGEIGFLIDGYSKYNCGDAVVFEGYADYIFPIMRCPNLNYFNKLVDKINKCTNSIERLNLKNRFNLWLGQEQNRNEFIRVAVIAQSNKKILDLISRYKNKIIFSVTDSLGSIERIPELDNMLGNKPGCWSIKNEGYLYTDRYNRLYLDNKGYITNSKIRGVPKQHVKGLNISEYKELAKKINPDKNLNKLDFEKRMVVKNG